MKYLAKKYKLNGNFTQYYPDGHIYIKGKLKDGIETGLWKYYNKQHQLIKKLYHKKF